MKQKEKTILMMSCSSHITIVGSKKRNEFMYKKIFGASI
jgi:hypothetical protein